MHTQWLLPMSSNEQSPATTVVGCLQWWKWESLTKGCQSASGRNCKYLCAADVDDTCHAFALSTTIDCCASQCTILLDLLFLLLMCRLATMHSKRLNWWDLENLDLSGCALQSSQWCWRRPFTLSISYEASVLLPIDYCAGSYSSSILHCYCCEVYLCNWTCKKLALSKFVTLAVVVLTTTFIILGLDTFWIELCTSKKSITQRNWAALVLKNSSYKIIISEWIWQQQCQIQKDPWALLTRT
jgi:hypothetical protein